MIIKIFHNLLIVLRKSYMSQTKRLGGVKVFGTHFRENKTIFADAPQNLRPVVLNQYSAGTHSDVVTEIEAFVTEFEAAL